MWEYGQALILPLSDQTIEKKKGENREANLVLEILTQNLHLAGCCRRARKGIH